MRESVVPSEFPAFDAIKVSPIDGLARKMLYSLLLQLRRGKLVFVEGDRHQAYGERTHDFPLEATVIIHHPLFFRKAVFRGSIGAAEAYMAGYWSADELTTVIRIVLLNQDVFERMDRGWARLTAPVYKRFHVLRENTREGSRTNITAHYDLGNDFYALFLDETMTYSCGIFEKSDSTLQEASIAKYDRICKKLQLTAGDHIIEIGSGWGGFAIHAAKNYGCRITTTTISREQYHLAKERIQKAGVTHLVEVLLEDYRDLKGKYEKLVSIEMIEAVGHQYYDTFFKCCSNLLREDGMMLVQAITIADHVFDEHKRSVDFIKRYIFPGSCIPSIAAMCDSVARVTDLRLFHLEDITPHYARTLRTWRERLFANTNKVRALGYSDTFIRMWEYYLCYCEAGFQERYLGDVQMLLTKPLCRREPILPEFSRSL